MSRLRAPRVPRTAGRTRSRFVPSVALFLSGALVITSCGPKDHVSFGEPRATLDPKVVYGVGSPERFGFAPRATEAAARPETSATSFRYELPDGWVERDTTPMRRVNVGIAREPRAEITLTTLAGDGGGLAENVRRWRGQLGLGPLDGEALAALPKALLLGRPAVRFDAEGEYAGMGAGGVQSGFRMVGLLAIAPEGSAFLKFTAPAAVVADELAAFDRFAASLQEVEAAPAAPRVAEAGPSVAARDGADGLVWTAPAGWRKGPDRPMRTVTYLAGPAGEVECYVAQLGGDGGGVRANLDRWRGQVGAGPLGDAEFAALPRVPILGGEAVLVEAEGSYRGMVGDAVADARMLGAVAIQSDGGTPERAVFVKLIGPRALVDAERDAFRAFVASLEDAR